MSTTKIKNDQLFDCVDEILSAYNLEFTSSVKSAVDKAATQCRKDIQAGAPVRTGRYKAGWSTKKVSETTTSKTVTVYNKDRYQIAHLLENGHAKRGGGRVKAYPHIKPAEEAATDYLIELTQKAGSGLI